MSATTYFTNSDINFTQDGSEFAIEALQLTGEDLESSVDKEDVLDWVNDQLTSGSLEEYTQDLLQLKDQLTSSNRENVEVEIDY